MLPFFPCHVHKFWWMLANGLVDIANYTCRSIDYMENTSALGYNYVQSNGQFL
jgi:hypothetical protein